MRLISGIVVAGILLAGCGQDEAFWESKAAQGIDCGARQAAPFGEAVVYAMPFGVDPSIPGVRALAGASGDTRIDINLSPTGTMTSDCTFHSGDGAFHAGLQLLTRELRTIPIPEDDAPGAPNVYVVATDGAGGATGGTIELKGWDPSGMGSVCGSVYATFHDGNTMRADFWAEMCRRPEW